jgi:hypothetical protein
LFVEQLLSGRDPVAMVMPRSFRPGKWEVDLFSYTGWQQNNASAADDGAGWIARGRVGVTAVRGVIFIARGCLGFRRTASGRRVVATSSDVGIVPVGSHPQCQISDGWRGVDRDDKKIDPLIVDVKDADHAHVTAPEPVHGDLPTASQPDSTRSAVPSDPAQREAPDQGSLGCEFLDQSCELDGGIR